MLQMPPDATSGPSMPSDDDDDDILDELRLGKSKDPIGSASVSNSASAGLPHELNDPIRHATHGGPTGIAHETAAVNQGDTEEDILTQIGLKTQREVGNSIRGSPFTFKGSTTNEDAGDSLAKMGFAQGQFGHASTFTFKAGAEAAVRHESNDVLADVGSGSQRIFQAGVESSVNHEGNDVLADVGFGRTQQHFGHGGPFSFDASRDAGIARGHGITMGAMGSFGGGFASSLSGNYMRQRLKGRIDECRFHLRHYKNYLEDLDSSNNIVAGVTVLLSLFCGAIILSSPSAQWAGYLSILSGFITGFHKTIFENHKQECIRVKDKYQEIVKFYSDVDLDRSEQDLERQLFHLEHYLKDINPGASPLWGEKKAREDTANDVNERAFQSWLEAKSGNDPNTLFR